MLWNGTAFNFETVMDVRGPISGGEGHWLISFISIGALRSGSSRRDISGVVP